jgi:5-formyltetrahydrofolate cyclo-ligase
LDESKKTTISQLKKEIRCSMLEARKNMKEQDLEQKSSAICKRLVELPEFAQASLVMAYMDFRNEVRTGEFIRECFKRGKRLALPVVFGAKGDASRIAAYEIEDLESCIKKSSFGICEPDIEMTNPVDETEIDLVIVPGVAFDCCMQRIGYGAGYYDKFLRKLKPGCKSVGIAFDIQLSDTLPCEEHDTMLDLIVTESRVIKNGQSLRIRKEY